MHLALQKKSLLTKFRLAVGKKKIDKLQQVTNEHFSITRQEHILSSCFSSLQVMEDVTGEEFVLLMRVVSGLRVLQTVNGRQQLVELVVEQAFLEQALNPADPDTVDRLLQCTRQALPLFSVSTTYAL